MVVVVVAAVVVVGPWSGAGVGADVGAAAAVLMRLSFLRSFERPYSTLSFDACSQR